MTHPEAFDPAALEPIPDTSEQALLDSPEADDVSDVKTDGLLVDAKSGDESLEEGVAELMGNVSELLALPEGADMLRDYFVEALKDPESKVSAEEKGALFEVLAFTQEARSVETVVTSADQVATGLEQRVSPVANTLVANGASVSSRMQAVVASYRSAMSRHSQGDFNQRALIGEHLRASEEIPQITRLVNEARGDMDALIGLEGSLVSAHDATVDAASAKHAAVENGRQALERDGSCNAEAIFDEQILQQASEALALTVEASDSPEESASALTDMISAEPNEAKKAALRKLIEAPGSLSSALRRKRQEVDRDMAGTLSRISALKEGGDNLQYARSPQDAIAIAGSQSTRMGEIAAGVNEIMGNTPRFVKGATDHALKELRSAAHLMEAEKRS